ncbi:hypothetical protein [Bradyrhizobium japonicum]|uniref:hypothetical protein n=1 Tax=Bradyrhizobium japonicum TaxID=375 RepID=UPI0003FCC848|nr:hypothetical protein [Bradyrhizobium japonicum]
MRITIVVPDNVVIVDGVKHAVDCSQFAGIHAVQWFDTVGDIEFVYDPDTRTKPLNETIHSLDQFQPVLDGLI